MALEAKMKKQPKVARDSEKVPRTLSIRIPMDLEDTLRESGVLLRGTSRRKASRLMRSDLGPKEQERLRLVKPDSPLEDTV